MGIHVGKLVQKRRLGSMGKSSQSRKSLSIQDDNVNRNTLEGNQKRFFTKVLLPMP